MLLSGWSTYRSIRHCWNITRKPCRFCAFSSSQYRLDWPASMQESVKWRLQCGKKALFQLQVYISLCFNSHFPGEPGLAGFYWSKGWWRWWWQLDYWSYKSCNAPVKSSPPRNQHPVFYRLDALPVTQPTVSKHWRENITFHGLAYLKLTWGLPTVSLTTNSSWLPWGGLPCLSSALWCQYPIIQLQVCL